MGKARMETIEGLVNFVYFINIWTIEQALSQVCKYAERTTNMINGHYKLASPSTKQMVANKCHKCEHQVNQSRASGSDNYNGAEEVLATKQNKNRYRLAWWGLAGNCWMLWEFDHSFHLLTAPSYFLTVSDALLIARIEGSISIRVYIDLVFRTSAFSRKNARLAMLPGVPYRILLLLPLYPSIGA